MANVFQKLLVNAKSLTPTAKIQVGFVPIPAKVILMPAFLICRALNSLLPSWSLRG